MKTDLLEADVGSGESNENKTAEVVLTDKVKEIEQKTNGAENKEEVAPTPAEPEVSVAAPEPSTAKPDNEVKEEKVAQSDASSGGILSAMEEAANAQGGTLVLASNEKEKELKIEIRNNIVQIHNTDQYTCEQSLTNPYNVVKEAKAKYKEVTGKDLDISDDSMAAEIFYHALAYVLHIKQSNSRISDIGEGKDDTNRWFWDKLQNIP